MAVSESDSLLGGPASQESKPHRKWLWPRVLVLIGLGGICAGLFLGKRSSVSKEVEGFTKKHRYKGTQFISFTINTIGGLDAHGECEGRDVDSNGVCYLGNPDDLEEDVEHRLKIIVEVLNRIKADRYSESPDIDHSSTVLKIFAMPEFFLRGPFGAYSVEQMYEGGILLKVADCVRELIKADAFKDYLFVFGTAIIAQTTEDTAAAIKAGEEDIHHLKASEILYHNFSPVYKGGTGHDDRYMVTKKYISTADFLNRTILPNPTNEDLREYAGFSNRMKKHLDKRNVTQVTNNLIKMDGLRIGIEICLDHRMGALWNNLRTGASGPVNLVDVQIITSAGMAIDRGPNPVVLGGVVYLSDGEASSAACLRPRNDPAVFDPDHVCREDIAGIKHIPTGGPGYTEFFPLTACWDLEKSELLKGYYSLYQTQGCAYTLKLYGIDVMDEFAYYPPSIEIYPTVSLPGYEW